MKQRIASISYAGVVACSVMFSGIASAVDFNITGFVRQEIGVSIAGNANELNDAGSPWNNRIVPHLTYESWGTQVANPDLGVGAIGQFVGPTVGVNSLLPVSIHPTGAFAGGAASAVAGGNTNSSANCRYAHQNAIAAQAGLLAAGAPAGFLGSGTFLGALCPNGAGSNFATLPTTPGTRAAGYSPQGDLINDDFNFNLFSTRLEVDIQARFNSTWNAYMKVRVYASEESAFTDARTGDSFASNYWYENSGTPLEWNSPDFMVDLPALYLDYNNGPLWVRVGNQTVAWGEAFFFRVMDVANGLDLRRHLTLGPGGEEFSDQRIASPGVRVSYTFKNGWEIDSFAQLWTPTVLPAQNHPYAVVAAGFSPNEHDEFKDARGAINFGARLLMPVTDQLQLTLMYTNRRNPDGVARFAEAPTRWAGRENNFCLGGHNDTNNLLKSIFGGDPTNGGTIAAMPTLQPGTFNNSKCGSPLAPDPLAVSNFEFFHLVGRSRLDPVKVLNVVVDEWPGDAWATREIFSFGKETNVVDALRTIEGFHSSFGSFHGWFTREFKREHILAVGFNYINYHEDPNSMLDQLLIRGEVSVTPNKKFTDLGLSQFYIEETEFVSAMVLEKYHRWTDTIPAMYMVAQWMHRTQSDLFGRHLSGSESVGLESFIDRKTGDLLPAALVPGAGAPRGSSSADYVVFAFQQPFPNVIWRVDFAILMDVEGGFFIQPGVRYRPSGSWQWDVYANFAEDGGDEDDDVLESLDSMDEIFLRLTYFF